MEMINTLNDIIVEYLGPLGPMILLGTLGLVIVALTISLMLSQPEDPMCWFSRRLFSTRTSL